MVAVTVPLGPEAEVRVPLGLEVEVVVPVEKVEVEAAVHLECEVEVQVLVENLVLKAQVLPRVERGACFDVVRSVGQTAKERIKGDGSL